VSNLAVSKSPFPINPGRAEQSEWGYGQLFSILLRRKWWVISIFLGTMATTVILTRRATVIYQSATQILIESSYYAPKGSSSILDPTVTVDTATQLRVLRSSEILQRAVDKLRTDYPTISSGEIRTGLDVQPIYATSEGGKSNVQTKLLAATYKSADAIKTQRVLDAVLAVYQSYNLEQQQKRIQNGLSTINRQLPEVRSSVIEAEKALEAFRKANNVIDPPKESETVTTALNQVLSERQGLQAKIKQDQANLNVVRSQLPASAETAGVTRALSQSDSVNALRKQEQDLKLKISSDSQELSPEHPDLLESKQNLANVQQLLSAEINRVTGGAGSGTGENISLSEISTNELELISKVSQLEQEISSTKARDTALAQNQAQFTEELKKFPVLIAQYTRLEPEVMARRGTLEKLLEEKESLGLEIAKGGFNWEIVEPPQPGIAVSPNVKQNLLIGIVVGLFLGALAAFIREALDDKVRGTSELNEQLAMPILGTVPQIGSGNRDFSLALPFRGSSSTIDLEAPEIFQWRPLREAMDLIYTNIQLLNSNRPHRSLMVTSALPGEGKSTLTIGLAISASRIDQRVLLIDADMRRPRLHEIFNLNNEHGLSTLLEGGLPENEILTIPQWVYMRWDNSTMQSANEQTPGLQRIRTPLSDLNIDVITSGPVSNDPAKLLTVGKLQEIIEIYKDNYDLILIDSPPVLGLADTISLGYSCDGVVMVARMDKVKRSEINRAIDTLNRLNVIGVIANGVNEQQPLIYDV
jgi:polysaccharide biosynthesis transport protein